MGGLKSTFDSFSPNESSGNPYAYEDRGEPLANKWEISWNGYPLPRTLRITDRTFTLSKTHFAGDDE